MSTPDDQRMSRRREMALDPMDPDDPPPVCDWCGAEADMGALCTACGTEALASEAAERAYDRSRPGEW